VDAFQWQSIIEAQVTIQMAMASTTLMTLTETITKYVEWSLT
jgi:hypothetical protein